MKGFTMRKEVAVLISIYIAVVTAITEESEDYRFTNQDGRKFVGRLVNGKNSGLDLRFVSHHHSSDKNTLYLQVADLQRTCGPYEMKLDYSKHDQTDGILLNPLTEDVMLLIPFSSSEDTANPLVSRLRIVDLSSCNVSSVLVPGQTEKVTFEKLLGIRDNSFDIAFRDPAMCGNSFCKQSYDFQGNNISVPILTYGPFMTAPQVFAFKSHSDGEIAIGLVHGKKIAFLVNDRFKKLQEFTKSDHFPAVSNENNFITFADRLNSKTLNITKFDLHGNLKFKTVLNYEYVIEQAIILNASNGYVYLVAFECILSKCNKNNHFVVKKIDASGKEVGSLVTKLPINSGDYITDIVAYASAESYCFSTLQVSFEELFTKGTIVHKCFNDADLSK